MVEAVVPVRRLFAGPGELVAHTPGPHASAGWHYLGDHLKETARLAAEFALPFGGDSLARFLGLVHDAGKATEDVQCALRARARDGGGQLGVAHKGEGAELGHLLAEAGNIPAAYVTYLANWGHHSGIPDWNGTELFAACTLDQEMKGDPHRLDELIMCLDDVLGVSLRGEAARVRLPEFVDNAIRNKRWDVLEFFTRMCHSSLVDADFLDTSRHFQAATEIDRSVPLGMDVLAEAFFATYEAKYGHCEDSEINRVRRDLFDRAVAYGRGPRTSGIYRLPAQTGTGKTMAAAAFALEHARVHGKQRVIVAVPYTSITTQNAIEYRASLAGLGDQVVLEHHSAIYDEGIADDPWRRLAAANWDAEFIVTTTVQLFNSLFSNKPSVTRKLHQLADSVVVLDEVQALPRDAVPAILTVLRELVEHYGTTVLLASATQPRFWALKEWEGLGSPQDIADPMHMPDATRRVQYEVRTRPQGWDEIADELAAEHQVLAIVNTTGDAQLLHELVCERSGDDSALHLSTRLCGRHRGDVLKSVKERLALGRAVRLVSTQVIEAGVDVDFPIVYRALAPADSVVQSAGRSNREGRLNGLGRVVVFQPRDGHVPPGGYKTATQQTLDYFVRVPSGGDRPRGCFSEPQDMDQYYALLDSLDLEPGMSKRVWSARCRLNFAKTATEFTMIDSQTVPVVVTAYGSAKEREEVEGVLARLAGDPMVVPNSKERRLLNQYTVALPLWLARSGLVAEPLAGAMAPRRWMGKYDPLRGVVIETEEEASIW
jgi:CRISPR-associated endonuclease/helicase Cas3